MAKRVSDMITNPNAQPFFFRGGEHGVLLIHGFTGSIAHMRPLGDALHQLGYTVKGINLPGHGTKSEDMRDVDWRNWIAACKEAYLSLREECSHVSIAGLSM